MLKNKVSHRGLARLLAFFIAACLMLGFLPSFGSNQAFAVNEYDQDFDGVTVVTVVVPDLASSEQPAQARDKYNDSQFLSVSYSYVPKDKKGDVFTVPVNPEVANGAWPSTVDKPVANQMYVDFTRYTTKTNLNVMVPQNITSVDLNIDYNDQSITKYKRFNDGTASGSTADFNRGDITYNPETGMMSFVTEWQNHEITIYNYITESQANAVKPMVYANVSVDGNTIADSALNPDSTDTIVETIKNNSSGAVTKEVHYKSQMTIDKNNYFNVAMQQLTTPNKGNERFLGYDLKNIRFRAAVIDSGLINNNKEILYSWELSEGNDYWISDDGTIEFNQYLPAGVILMDVELGTHDDAKEPVSPVLLSRDGNSGTLSFMKAADGYQYRLSLQGKTTDNKVISDWSSNPSYTGLTKDAKYTIEYKSPSGVITARTFKLSGATADNYYTPFAENEEFTTTMYAIGHAGSDTSARSTQHNEVVFDSFAKNSDATDDGAKLLKRYVADTQDSVWLTGYKNCGWSADLCMGPNNGVLGVNVKCITPVAEQVQRGVAVFRVSANLNSLNRDYFAGTPDNAYVEPESKDGNQIRHINSLYGYFTVDLEKPIHFELTKKSNNTDITTKKNGTLNGAYDVNNAEYQITAGTPAGTAADDLKYYTDTNGKLVTLDFPAETAYTIKETVPSDHGYMINTAENIFPAKTNDFGTAYKKDVFETPMSKTWSFSKVDAESNTNKAQSGASLADGVFKVSYYAVSPISGAATGTPERVWYLKSTSDGKISLDSDHLLASYDGQQSDAVYRNNSGAMVFPLGKYTLQEVKAPTGYQLNDTTSHEYAFDVTAAEQKGSTETLAATSPVHTFKDTVIRGDLKFIKQDAASPTPNKMPKVPFLLTNKHTGETHVILTDENGIFNSSTANLGITVNKDTNTNGNDKVVDHNPTDGVFTDEEAESMDESALNINTGIWYQGYKNQDPISTNVNNLRGSLPYGYYRLEELPCAANFGKQLVAIDDILIDAIGTKEIGNVTADTIEDADVVMGSILTDGITNTHLGNASYDADAKKIATVSMVDQVTVSGLTQGKVTRIDAVPYKVTEYKEDGTPSKVEPLKDADGKEYKFTSGEFTPSGDATTQYINITLPASVVAGNDIIVRESLTIGKLHRADHDPLAYEAQSGFDWNQVVTYPVADDTVSVDKTSQDVEGVALGDNITITNKIEYKKLTRGQQYIAKGTVYAFAADGTYAVLTDENGNAFTTEQRIDGIESRDGEFTLECAVPRKLAEGKTLALFIQVIGTGDNENRLLTSNLSDKVYYPKMLSTAIDGITKAHEGSASAEQVNVRSIATYQNLNLDRTYVMRTVLVDKSNDQVIKNADGTEMMYDVKFVAGRGVIEPEEVAEEPIAEEALATLSSQLEILYNLASYAQEHPENFAGVTVPTLAEPATIMDEISKAIADGDTAAISSIEDEINKYAAWYGVLTDEERQDNGLVSAPSADEVVAIIQRAIAEAESKAGEMNAMADDEDADATPLDSSLRAAGSFPVDFFVDSDSIAGKKVVVKHYLFTGEEINDDAKINELHELTESDDRTVSYPKFTAVATVNGVHVATALPDTTLIENVQYVNMIPGQEYRMVGVLMNAKTGDVMGVNDQPIVAQTVFTPQDANGSVDITFNFDASRFANKDVVVFMNAYRNSDTLQVDGLDVEKDVIPEEHMIYVSKVEIANTEADAKAITFPETIDFYGVELGEPEIRITPIYETESDAIASYHVECQYSALVSGKIWSYTTNEATSEEAIANLPEYLPEELSPYTNGCTYRMIEGYEPNVDVVYDVNGNGNIVDKPLSYKATALYEYVPSDTEPTVPAIITILNDQLINVGSIEDLTLASQTVHFEPEVLPVAAPVSETGDMLLRVIGATSVIAVAVASVFAYRRRKSL